MKASLTADLGRIANLYRSYMDVDRLDDQGVSPLADRIETIETASDHAALSRLMMIGGYQSVFAPSVAIDVGDPESYALSVRQGGLGLPAKDYYVSDSPPSPTIGRATSAISRTCSALPNSMASPRRAETFSNWKPGSLKATGTHR